MYLPVNQPNNYKTAMIEIAVRQMAETEHIELGKMNVREGIDETTITSKS